MNRSKLGGDRWRTPPDFYARLDAEFHFALDAACERANCLAPAGIYHDEGRDALQEPWHTAGGAVFCNPPYSNLRPWIEKMAEEGRLGVVVAVVPGDTSTRWWYDVVAQLAREVRFVRGRLRFLRDDGSLGYRGGQPRSTSAALVFAPAGGPPVYRYIPARA